MICGRKRSRITTVCMCTTISTDPLPTEIICDIIALPKESVNGMVHISDMIWYRVIIYEHVSEAFIAVLFHFSYFTFLNIFINFFSECYIFTCVILQLIHCCRSMW